MNAKKLYFILCGASVLSVAAIIATTYFANSLLKKNSEQLTSVKLDNKVIEEREKYLIQAKKDLETYKDLSATLEKVLPKDKDEARTVAELYTIAEESGLQVTRISFPSSSLGLKTAAAATKTAAPAVTQAKALEGVKGVLSITTAIELEGNGGSAISYNQIMSFLQKVEQNRRSMQVSDITVNSTDKAGELTFSVGLNIFIKP